MEALPESPALPSPRKPMWASDHSDVVTAQHLFTRSGSPNRSESLRAGTRQDLLNKTTTLSGHGRASSVASLGTCS